jgi:hypothetical protein
MFTATDNNYWYNNRYRGTQQKEKDAIHGNQMYFLRTQDISVKMDYLSQGTESSQDIITHICSILN